VERITNLKMTRKGWMEQRNPDWGLQKVDNWSRRKDKLNKPSRSKKVRR
jgi:hypothetical protein